MKNPFAGMKKSKKMILIAAAALILAAAVLPKALHSVQEHTLSFDDTTVLAYADFVSSIPASGTVESADSTFVYSTLPYTVQAVHVEVGDTVEEGQLLAELDAENIQNQIRSQQAALGTTRAGNQTQIANAQATYEHFKENLENGLNTTLLSAQAQVGNAYDAYLRAETAYERMEKSVKRGDSAAVLNAEIELRQAEASYDSLKEQYDAAKTIYDSAVLLDPAADDTQLRSLRQALDKASDACDLAETAYKAAKRTVEDTLDDYADAVDSAYEAYETALTAYEAAEKGTQEQLEAYERNLESARTNTGTATMEESLRQLRVSLADTKIKAPCAGTVTAVYATVGGNGSGLLFVIEDVEHLIIETSIKEYDLAAIKLGMPVEITSHVTGDKIIRGTVTKLAPTAEKNAMGTTNTMGDASFAVELSVDEENSGLYIGMEVQLDYIITSLKNVLYVPYDSVYENDGGESCVIVLTEQDDGKYLLSEQVVTLGADNDLDVVVTGIDAGTRILNEPEVYRDMIGKAVTAEER